MIIDELKQLLESGQFHHATYRNASTLWEGLWIYAKDSEGFRGYTVAGCFNKNKPEELKLAEDMVRGTSVSFGAYGQG